MNARTYRQLDLSVLKPGETVVVAATLGESKVEIAVTMTTVARVSNGHLVGANVSIIATWVRKARPHLNEGFGRRNLTCALEVGKVWTVRTPSGEPTYFEVKQIKVYR